MNGSEVHAPPPVVIRFYPRRELTKSRAQWKDIVPHIHREIAEGIASAKGVVCKPGCAHCCKLQVEALPHEIMEVVDYVRFGDHFDREARGRILERLRYAVEQTDGLDAHAYRDKDIPCPFLGDDNLCSVYPVRPVSCRAFASTNVEVCKLVEPDDGVSTFRVLPGSLMRLTATSGLFFTSFLKGCLDWWQGEGVEAKTTADEVQSLLHVREMLDARGAR